MYRLYYNPETNAVRCYEDVATAEETDNSFLINEIPQGEGLPYVDIDTQTVYFMAPETTPIPEPEPEPIENYLVELDFRLSLIELGVI